MVSRSHRHTPITGITTAASEQQDKRRANRKLRRATRQAIQTWGALVDATELPLLREVSNVWDMAKDGRRYWTFPVLWIGPEDEHAWRTRIMRK